MKTMTVMFAVVCSGCTFLTQENLKPWKESVEKGLQDGIARDLAQDELITAAANDIKEIKMDVSDGKHQMDALERMVANPAAGMAPVNIGKHTFLRRADAAPLGPADMMGAMVDEINQTQDHLKRLKLSGNDKKDKEVLTRLGAIEERMAEIGQDVSAHRKDFSEARQLDAGRFERLGRVTSDILSECRSPDEKVEALLKLTSEWMATRTGASPMQIRQIIEEEGEKITRGLSGVKLEEIEMKLQSILDSVSRPVPVVPMSSPAPGGGGAFDWLQQCDPATGKWTGRWVAK